MPVDHQDVSSPTPADASESFGLLRPAESDDTFELFDLRVSVEEIRGLCTCGHVIGDFFELYGGQLRLPPGRSFCIYALQSTLPLLPAKQRPLQAADWMGSDNRVVCPDPACGVVMRVDRTAVRRLRHSETSALPLARHDDPVARHDDPVG